VFQFEVKHVSALGSGKALERLWKSCESVRMSMEERARRIVESAVALAEEGGFEGVRLRDVAAHADVALGTLYRRFRSKEDLLVAALDLEMQDLERRIQQRPPKGDSELERVTSFFSTAVRGLLRRPNLARAMVKAVASGEPEVAQQVAAFHGRVEKLVVGALRGKAPLGEGGAPPSEKERRLATALDLLWLGVLVGWSGGVYDQSEVIDEMSSSAKLLLFGARDMA
jgi:AcrR family transcriptional regulator